MTKRMYVTILVDTLDADGEPFVAPERWDWEDLVGPNTEFVSANDAEDEDETEVNLSAWPEADLLPCVRDGEHHATQCHPFAECPTGGAS